MDMRLVFREFDDFPDDFEDLKALKPLEYLQFIISIVDFQSNQIEEFNKRFDIIDINYTKRLIQEIVEKEGEKRIGAITLKNIVNLLFIIIRFQINTLNSEAIKNEKGRNLPKIFFLRKYLNPLERVANKKVEELYNNKF
jgi:hypothetical protein